VDYHALAKHSRLLLIGALGLMVAVQVVGVTYGGAQRWLDLGPLSFQPSDFLKVALVLYVAVLLAKKQAYVKSFTRAFLPVMLWTGAGVGLIGLEDLSTAALVFMAVMTMAFVARVSVLHIGALGAICLAAAFALLMTSPHRAARVEAFTGVKIFPNTTAEEVFDAQNEGYQAQQARIAVALGGFRGQGPGKSTQRDFLPAPYNDFIFAIIAEEYGLWGVTIVLGLLSWLLFRGFLRIARHAPDPLGLFLGVGLTTMVVLYGFVHAGVSVGLLPVTGLPLPFVSYGGTSMLFTGAMIGLLLNISRQCE
jgi:cell division protein FtsW